MPAWLFWIFALVMLVFGAAVVINRNPVASALSLVVTFLGLSALFVSLNAYFIGVIQVLVYAGAVMVLFLFIIMLLDLRAEEVRRLNWAAVGGGAAVALLFFLQVAYVIAHLKMGRQTMAQLPKIPTDDVHNIGMLLFTKFTLPFQLIGVLVLVATIGVVVLSRRESR
jgi:NADH-quinone oxidoreductase subunit J